MRYVLDASVPCAPRVRGPNPLVESWSVDVSVAGQFVAALTISEIGHGVIARNDPILLRVGFCADGSTGQFGKPAPIGSCLSISRPHGSWLPTGSPSTHRSATHSLRQSPSLPRRPLSRATSDISSHWVSRASTLGFSRRLWGAKPLTP